MSADLIPSNAFACNFHPETKTEGENVATFGVAEKISGQKMMK